ncbi:hypothetical protein BRD06_00220 [Halobacteriales archaeon QS_9_67_15]|nr:MAG: hypothetical protein BRD06_00220 [Halobacteriales archaeon QS_9_67_15]
MGRADRGRDARNSRRSTAEPLTGQCEHCSWHTAQSSYSAVVEAYHDHLRENHHDAWVRA